MAGMREEMATRGVVKVANGLSKAAVSSLLESISLELSKDISERYSPGESGTSPLLNLLQSHTWPRGGQRRVVEITPPGGSGLLHWDALKGQSGDLRSALDVLLGDGRWEIPPNKPPADANRIGEDCQNESENGDVEEEEESHAALAGNGESIVRHWYCPIAFPEDAPSKEIDKSETTQNDTIAVVWSREEDELLSALLSPSPAMGGQKAKRPAWGEIVQRFPGRCVKDCKERWGELAPWSPEEDHALLQAYKKLGPSWTQLQKLPALQVRERTKRGAQRRIEILLEEETEASIENKGIRETCSEDIASSWTAVSRRRVRGKGWHVDIGPGFGTSWKRYPNGHRFQGCVVLVLLSDCPPGAGGTAFAIGSHNWVYDYLRRQEVCTGGVPHEELNRWAMKEVHRRQIEGRLRYDYDPAPADSRIEQMVGVAGDVWLMHPFLLHSGTTNLSQTPRVLANGMARVRAWSWAEVGHPLLSRDLFAGAISALDLELFEQEMQKQERILTEEGIHIRKRAGNFLCLVQRDLAKPVEMRHTDSTLPLVSVIVPVHNANRTSFLSDAKENMSPVPRKPDESSATWLDDCFGSVLRQSYNGPLEVSVFDDASDDGSDEVIRAWVKRFASAGIKVVASGSRWRECGGGQSEKCRGIGYCRNRAVQQSHGEYLCFLDADDVMLPKRIEAQLEASIKSPDALVGAGLIRFPESATKHYMDWTNSLMPQELWLQQFRECTLLCPSWFMRRALYNDVGGFEEAPGDPQNGEGEDLTFFLRHLELLENRTDISIERISSIGLHSPLVRVGGESNPLVCYRYTSGSASSRCSRRRLAEIRAQAFERRVIWGGELVTSGHDMHPNCGFVGKGWASTGFSIWGAGRDARDFMRSLSARAIKRVRMLIDLDPSRCGSTYCDHSRPPDERCEIPIVHFRDAAAGLPHYPGPVVVCVSSRASEKRLRGGESFLSDDEDANELRKNVSLLGLTEGRDLWFFS